MKLKYFFYLLCNHNSLSIALTNLWYILFFAKCLSIRLRKGLTIFVETRLLNGRLNCMMVLSTVLCIYCSIWWYVLGIWLVSWLFPSFLINISCVVEDNSFKEWNESFFLMVLLNFWIISEELNGLINVYVLCIILYFVCIIAVWFIIY